MRNIMYLRPGNMYKDFAVEECVTELDSGGRASVRYDTDKGIMLRGCLAAASSKEIARFGQLGRPVTHTIVQNGRRRAKPDDLLRLGDRTFLIQGVDEAGSLGVCTIYYAEERRDVT